MDKIRIIGGNRLSGTINIAGAKNAALPIMAASLLTADNLVLSGMPHLADIIAMANLLIQHGVTLEMDGSYISDYKQGKSILLNASNIHNKKASYEAVRKMRASVWVLGPLLARFGEAIVSLPGGCAIGSRPIDLHLNALKEMGADIYLESGYIYAKTNGRLKGAEIFFDKISVGATVTVIMAATLATGKTTIHNAAREPEISDLIKCLRAMGAKIQGTDSSTITIEGVDALHGAHHKIISDRIEAGTYAIASIITKGDILLQNIDISVMDSVIEKLIQVGADIEAKENSLRVIFDINKKIKSTDLITLPYPGFPTDLQAQFMALMCVADGSSLISETIFENRFMHALELSRMGANITINGNNALVRTVDFLSGAEVMATDLRASVSLVLAALAAKGETTINRVYHIDRGYEYIEDKLLNCGANIVRTR